MRTENFKKRKTSRIEKKKKKENGLWNERKDCGFKAI